MSSGAKRIKYLHTICNLPLIGGFISLFVGVLPAIVLLLFVIVLPQKYEEISGLEVSYLLISLVGAVVTVWNFYLLRRNGVSIVLPVVPIPLWVAGIAWTVLALLTSIDEVGYSMQYPTLDVVTIEEVEAEGLGERKFAAIKGGLIGTPILYTESETLEMITGIVYPLVSHPDAAANTLVLIKKAVNIRKDDDLEAWIQANVDEGTGADTRGRVITSWESLNEETRNLLSEAALDTSQPLVLVNANRLPRPLQGSLILLFTLIGAIFISVHVLYVYFTDRSSKRAPV